MSFQTYGDWGYKHKKNLHFTLNNRILHHNNHFNLNHLFIYLLL